MNPNDDIEAGNDHKNRSNNDKIVSEKMECPISSLNRNGS